MHANSTDPIRPMIAAVVFVVGYSMLAYGQSVSSTERNVPRTPRAEPAPPDQPLPPDRPAAPAVPTLDARDATDIHSSGKRDRDDFSDEHGDASDADPYADRRDSRPSRLNRQRVRREINLDWDEPAERAYVTTHSAPVISSSRHFRSDGVDRETARAIRETVEKLRKASDDNSRSIAANDLRKLLEAAFDQDYERRHDELTRLEERVAKLRKQLDRRKEARDDIIDVRVKSLLYDAEGISFPDGLGMIRGPRPVGRSKNRSNSVRQWLEFVPDVAHETDGYTDDDRPSGALPKRRP